LLTLAIAQADIGILGLLPADKNAPCPLRNDAFKSARLNNLDFLAFAFSVATVFADKGFLLTAIMTCSFAVIML
jgi:hypothetical protein